MSFFSWLAEQRDREDPIGDLARDVADDAGFPRDLRGLSELSSYLSSKHADARVHEVAEEAWSAFTDAKAAKGDA